MAKGMTFRETVGRTDEFCPSHHLRINQIPLHKQSKSTVLAQESIRQNVALEGAKVSISSGNKLFQAQTSVSVFANMNTGCMTELK